MKYFHANSIELHSISGVVAAAQAYSSTHVSSQAVTTDVDGKVSGGAVTSHVFYHEKFFIRQRGGQEQLITLTASSPESVLGVRDGHSVVAVWLEGRPFHYLYNSSTNREYIFEGIIKANTERWWSIDRPIGGILHMALGLLIWYIILFKWHWERLFGSHLDNLFVSAGNLIGAPLFAYLFARALNRLLTRGSATNAKRLLASTRESVGVGVAMRPSTSASEGAATLAAYTMVAAGILSAVLFLSQRREDALTTKKAAYKKTQYEDSWPASKQSAEITDDERDFVYSALSNIGLDNFQRASLSKHCVSSRYCIQVRMTSSVRFYSADNKIKEYPADGLAQIPLYFTEENKLIDPRGNMTLGWIAVVSVPKSEFGGNVPISSVTSDTRPGL